MYIYETFLLGLNNSSCLGVLQTKQNVGNEFVLLGFNLLQAIFNILQ